jgi:hypothetical protein
MFKRLFGGGPTAAAGLLVSVRVNARLQPMDRGAIFEDPLADALSARGLGTVTGGGTHLLESGEIEACDIEVEVAGASPERLHELVEALETLGAPKGSSLRLAEGAGEPIPFGRWEGLALYLNGTDLPDAVYAQCDPNFVRAEIDRLLEGTGRVMSYWDGPTETALYVYGQSFADMRTRLQAFFDTYPLCQRARVVQVA